jgi:hypothetical protein
MDGYVVYVVSVTYSIVIIVVIPVKAGPFRSQALHPWRIGDQPEKMNVDFALLQHLKTFIIEQAFDNQFKHN